MAGQTENDHWQLLCLNPIIETKTKSGKETTGQQAKHDSHTSTTKDSPQDATFAVQASKIKL